MVFVHHHYACAGYIHVSRSSRSGFASRSRTFCAPQVRLCSTHSSAHHQLQAEVGGPHAVSLASGPIKEGILTLVRLLTQMRRMKAMVYKTREQHEGSAFPSSRDLTFTLLPKLALSSMILRPSSFACHGCIDSLVSEMTCEFGLSPSR